MLSPNNPRPETKKSKHLVIIPETMSIVTAASHGVEVECIPGPDTLYLTPPTNTSKDGALVAPFWFVRTTTDGSEVNMKRSIVPIKVSCACGSKVIDKTVRVPVMVNTKDLHDGDELFVVELTEGEKPGKRARSS